MKKKFLFVLLFIFCFNFCVFCANEFTLNFNNVDIRTFIKFVSEFTKKNYVLDQGVRGNITVYSQKSVPVEDIDKIFSTILNLYGYTVINKENISLIVPIPDGKIQSGEINIGEIPEQKRESFINQIIPLQYYPAQTISQILSPYLTKGSQITVEERTNSLIISDIGVNIVKMMEIIEKIDTPSPPGKEEFRIYRLENASAEEIAKVLSQILSQKRQKTVVSRGRTQTASTIQPSVVAAKSTNSLIIYSDPDDFQTIENLIKELDVMANQVFIEALIAEVTYSKTQDIGVEWMGADSINDKYTGEAKLDFDVAEKIPYGLTIGIYKGILDIGGLIKLYGKDTKFNILSTPQIMTADNQEASINVSENIPYLTSTRFVSSTTSSTGDTIKSYDYKDVGIVLKITPQISRDKYVKLKISQEVTKLLEGGEAPTTAKRSVDTTLIVPNNKTIVLGGLIRNDREKTIQKVPFFGDIPLIGKLFQKKTEEDTKTNLFIFITPHIISRFEDADKISKEKEGIIKGLKDEK